METEPSEMSFALSLDKGSLEWASHGLGSIFCQRGNLLRPSFWRMIWDVTRFGQHAPKASSEYMHGACAVWSAYT